MTDLRPFGVRLRKILGSKEAYAILDAYEPGVLWVEGGCRLLGEALTKVLREQHFPAKMVCICTKVDGTWIQDHVVVQVGEQFIDRDGVRPEHTLLSNWSKQERSGAPTRLCAATSGSDGRIAGAKAGGKHVNALADLIRRVW